MNKLIKILFVPLLALFVGIGMNFSSQNVEASENSNTNIPERFIPENIKRSLPDGDVLIGQKDGKLSDIMNNKDDISPLAESVWYHSHATYNSTDGVSIYIELYLPSGGNPGFTGMYGSATGELPNSIRQVGFSKSANGTKTISITAKTGAKGKSGDTGMARFSGVATANNALGGGGGFAGSYAISIP